ncbi:MAG: nucleoside-diphosphate sugar epimerase/dehydratase [Elusimicrobiota bacterium]
MNIKKIIVNLRRPLIVLLHLCLILIAYIFAFNLRFEFKLLPEDFKVMLRTLPLLIIIKLLFFYFFGVFSGLWRYVSIGDLWDIILANFLSSVAFTLSVLFYHTFYGYPRSVFIIDFILCTVFVSSVRFFTRLIRERFQDPLLSLKKKNVLIVGAGQAGISVSRECQNNPIAGLNVVGFIDDDTAKKGLSIFGLRIFGGRKMIPDIVSKYDIKEIILAIPSVKGEVIRDILSYCEMTDANIKIVPGFDKIISGHLEVKPRKVQPDDLLGREPVKIDETEISSYIRNKKVLVTGAGGSIGAELCRQIVKFSPELLILLDNHENYVYYLGVEFSTLYPQLKCKTVIGDIKDIGLLRHLFFTYRPDVVFHAAAHKHVPLMEENPVSAVKNNIIGSRNLIYASSHYGVEKFVLISTDKAVNPTSVMGATKRIAEKILQAKSKVSKTKFMAVRFGNVLGSSGSVIPLFKKQIEEGGPVTVTHPDVKRYFMSIPEAAILVLQAGAIGSGGEIFILDMGEQIKIVDLAKNIIAFSGLKLNKDISIKYVGLRPGEKLYEEILLDKEKDKVTKNKKIYVTTPENFDLPKIRKDIRELEHLAVIMDEEKILKKLKQMVPNYVSQADSTINS